MNIRQELETLLSISQGTMEDYNEYLLRVLEEVNAVDDPIFNALSKGTQDWVNAGVLAYNGNQPILGFPKTATQVKVEPIAIVSPETVVEEPIKAVTIIPDVVSSEIEAETQVNMNNIGNIENIIPDVISEEELDLSTLPKPIFISNEEEALEELEKMKVIYERAEEMGIVPEKKKRGRKKGTKNKPKDMQWVVEDFTERVMGIVESSESNEKISTVVESTENKSPLFEYECKFVEESMGMETEEFIVPEGTITEQDIDAEYASIFKTTIDEHIASAKSEENSDSIKKPQKPLDVFRTVVCQNHDKPFEAIYKLSENQSIGIKKSTALVTCSQIKATINTLKSLGMLKESLCK